MRLGYFDNELDDNENWLSTRLYLTQKTTPFYQILTGGEHERFILTTPKFKCHWGKFLHSDTAYFAGIRLWRNDVAIEPKDMPIAPITSAQIEQAKLTLNDNHNSLLVYQYWANFYAKQLLIRPSHFLHTGNWKIYPMVWGQQPKYCKGLSFSYLGKEFLQDIDRQDCFFDWDGFPFDSAMTLKNLPDKDNGRVKWWQKKIAENRCPPLLFWWHHHTQCFVLVDGHARLQAYQLVDKQPLALCVTAVNIEHISADSPEMIEGRLKALQGIKASIAKKESKNQPIDTETIYQILMNFYQDFHHESLTSLPKVVANLDDIFEKDVKKLLLKCQSNKEFIQALLR